MYLRGGIYYERVTCRLMGHRDAPITVRSFPGEMAVLDGGMREFLDGPVGSWEPWREGAEGEYVSTRAYPGASRAAAFFADSMIPLHAYRLVGDLRSDNVFWTLKDKMSAETGIYCGPGVWYDSDTAKIHVRLRPFSLPVLDPSDHYQGETDPRRLPLLVHLDSGPLLQVADSKHVRFQDLVLRAGGPPSVSVRASENIELDHVTVYSVFTAFVVESTARLRILRCAFRGMAAPWSFRGHHKYRSMDKFLFSTGGASPLNRDFEFAWSEFTDDHDGLHLGGVQGLKFHHNLVENFNDDGIFLTAKSAEAGDIEIYQNRLSRCLTLFAFGYGHQTFRRYGTGVLIYRNIIELIRPVHYELPASAAATDTGGCGRVSGDHGSPTWEPLSFYHNTFVSRDPGWRGYALGLGYHTGVTPRRVFNNIFVVTHDMPNSEPPAASADFMGDGNLFWSIKEGPAFRGDFHGLFRKPPILEAGRRLYAPGWEAHGLFADPGLVQFSGDMAAVRDYRLKPDSPAVNAGVPIPLWSPDPVAEQDEGRPDIGAIPLGCSQWEVGVRNVRRDMPLREKME